MFYYLLDWWNHGIWGHNMVILQVKLIMKILRIAWNTVKILYEVAFPSPEKSAHILAVNVSRPVTGISVQAMHKPANTCKWYRLKAKVITLAIPVKLGGTAGCSEFLKSLSHTYRLKPTYPVSPSPCSTPLIALESVNLCNCLCRGLPAVLWVAGICLGWPRSALTYSEPSSKAGTSVRGMKTTVPNSWNQESPSHTQAR